MREESIRVGEGASILSGYPFSSDGFSTERGLPLIRIRDISSRQTEIRFDGAYDDDFVVEPGDVLIGMDGDFIASKWVGEPGLLNQRVLKISADADSLDQGYLYHWLQPKLDEIHRRTPQTTVRHLSIKDVRAIELPNFPLPEQRRIARVLDTVDAAIRQTEAVIAKLKQVKAGLLHDLLTRGLDENGELRDPVRHPEQFKDSPLGRIPKEWEVVRLAALLTDSSLGTTRRGDTTEVSVPLIKMGNLTWGALSLDQVEYVDVHRVDDIRTASLQYNDLLFNTRNTPDLVGKTAVWKSQLSGAVCDNNILRMQLAADASPDFVCAYMSTGKGKRLVRQMVTGTTSVAAIYWRSLKSFVVPKPPRGELNRFDKLVSRIEGDESLQGQKLNKLKKLKQGLMQDLLTGRVRVPEGAVEGVTA